MFYNIRQNDIAAYISCIIKIALVMYIFQYKLNASIKQFGSVPVL